MNTEQPKPGSPEAVALGCICPPQVGPDVIYDENCPLHAAADSIDTVPRVDDENR